MIRKTIAALAVSLVLAIVAAPMISAQMLGGVGQLPEAALAEMKKEGPLTQADIDVYIKLLPKMGEVMTNPSALADLHKSSGLSEIRLSMVMTKVAYGQAISQGMTMEMLEQASGGQIPEPMKPTAAEVELVKKNLDNLNKATMELQTNIQNQQKK